MNVTDPRLAAFCSNGHPELFHAIVHRHEIFRHDTMDVPEVHEEAREAFARVMNSVGAGLQYGKILLLLGEAGSGKTHLMRAFRSEVVRKAAGYFTYMQMTSGEANYEQYVLTNIIDSLNQPYDDDLSEQTALRRLSNALVEDKDLFDPGALQFLREEELNLPWVFECSDYLIARLKVQNIHPDLLRVLLLLQRDEPELKNLILQYLRCRPLSDYDLKKLGGIAPLHGEGGPREVIRSLAALAWALDQSTFVICLDQLEDIYELNEPVQTRFLSAMRVVRELTDAVPSLVVVISCLEDFYAQLKPSLTASLLDRIEKNPEPAKLTGIRTAAEVEKIIVRRLEHLFEDSGTDIVPTEPLFPFVFDLPVKLQGARTRTVLDLCRAARERSQRDGQRPVVANTDVGRPEGTLGQVTPGGSEGLVLEQLWNDHYTTYSEPLPEREAEMSGLLVWALTQAANELPGNGWTVKASGDGGQLATQLENYSGVLSRSLVTLCNQKAQGGALGNAVDAARERAKNQDRRCVIVRTTSFPESPRTVIARKLGELITEGGARTIIEDSDWRAMAAMQTFVARHGSHQGFAEWLCNETPLTKLRPISVILKLDDLPPTTAVPAALPGSTGRVDPKPDAPPEPAPATQVIQPAGRSWLGMTKELAPSPVTIDHAELTRHTAFLGGSGSGKTTLALNLIESLLLSGVPAVLIDRKGDLCSYASEAAWQQPLSSPEAEARRTKLRESIEVSLYTPGRDDGRPLCLPMIPDGLADMKPTDRDIAAKHTAGALAGMMGYKANGNDAAKTVVLQKALSVLAQVHPDMSLDKLLGIVHDEDATLINAIGYLDTKHFKKLVQDLETLRLGNADLVEARGEKLSAESLFHSPHGKTRLTIISTKFFDSSVKLLFWISQFLQEMNRYASKQPSDKLQAVLLFDEADLYLPATSKPSTKEPMENALKRFRSAGLGMFLATQSPGDFDYKAKDNIRNWFVGRVKEPTALAKMKPMLSEARIDVASKLPAQGPGQFYVIRDGAVTSLQAARSLVSPSQLSDEEILALARAQRPVA